MAIRVCHVASNHNPKDGRIFERECVSLAKEYEVYLIAPNTKDEIVNGVNILGVDLPQSRIRRPVKLGRVYKKMIEVDADVYHFHDPELIHLGLKIHKKGKKIIYDSHEDFPAHIKYKYYIPKWFRNPMSWFWLKYEEHAFRKFNALVSVTPSIVDRLKSINPLTFQITNYPKFEERASVSLNDNRKICFAGLLSKNWMLENIISILPEVNATLLLAGNCPSIDYFNELKSLPGWDRVRYMGVLSHPQVIELYQQSTLGLAVESYDNPNAGFRTGSLGCTKIPDYMASGLPVIVSNSYVWGEIVRRYDCGAVVDDPTNREEIAEAIKSILDNPNRATLMGDNSKKASKEEFNWDSQVPILYDLYKTVLNN